MIKNIWKDPVWSKVIAAAIIAVLGFGGAYFAGLLPKFEIVVMHIWNFLIDKTSLNNWLIIVLSIPLIIMLILFFAYLKESNGEEHAPGPLIDFTNYNSDTFFNMNWRWSLGSDGSPYAVTPFCPKCDYQIMPKFDSSFRIAPRYAFICEDCGFDGGAFEGEYPQIEQKVILKIQKDIRTGKWKEKINAQQRDA